MQPVEESVDYARATQILADLIALAAVGVARDPAKWRPLLDVWKARRKGLRVSDHHGVQEVISRDGHALAELTGTSL